MGEVVFREDLPLGPSWGFFSEDEDFCAGFESEEAATKAFKEYVSYVETGEPGPQNWPGTVYWEVNLRATMAGSSCPS
jgi:hypothetical protein